MLSKSMEETLYGYIVLPYVLKIFKDDYKFFEQGPFKATNIYLDKLDTVINSVQDDLNAIKKEMFSKYHMKVRNLGNYNGYIRFDWQTPNDSGDLLLTPNQLRELTKDMMRLYLYGFLAREVIPSNRPWY